MRVSMPWWAWTDFAVLLILCHVVGFDWSTAVCVISMIFIKVTHSHTHSKVLLIHINCQHSPGMLIHAQLCLLTIKAEIMAQCAFITVILSIIIILLIYFPPSGCFSSGQQKASLSHFFVEVLMCARHCFLHEHISPKVLFNVVRVSMIDSWTLVKVWTVKTNCNDQ